MASSDESSDIEISDIYHLRSTHSLHYSREASNAKGKHFLAVNARKFFSVTNTNVKLRDNFSQLLILEITGDKNLITLESHDRSWNYFIGQPFGTTQYYPDDFDTTSIAWTVLPARSGVVQSILDEIISLNGSDGIITTYFDTTRPRIDPVVCVNVLNLCYKQKYSNMSSLCDTESYIISVLESRSYLTGTRYYASPEPFLFFLARLLNNKNAQSLRAKILSLLQQRIRERAGLTGDALELSMRILAGVSTGVGWKENGFVDERLWDGDVMKLRALQDEDGGWEIGWLCRYGKSGVLIGNRGLTTALAMKALEEVGDV